MLLCGVLKLVKNGYRYNDIAIITKNLDTYSSIAKVVFDKYNIPIFIDEKKELNQNQLAKYILSIFEVISNNWKYESVFNYLKNSFSNIDIDVVHKLENYCTKWGIKNNKWLKPWNDEMLEPIRQIIVQEILEFKDEIYNQKTFINITESLNEIELANEYKASYSVIINVLNEIVKIFGKETTTIDRYKEILKIGLKNINIGEIPARLDQVVMGDISRSKSNKIKALFIIGLNDGVFPSQNSDEGFLDDSDRDKLKELGIELAKRYFRANI